MRIATNGCKETDNKILELSFINDSLQKDVVAKDREIRRLNKDLQQYEQTMATMRDETKPDVPKKNAEVMAGMCCTGTECGDLVPVKDIGELLREETSKYRERLQNMEVSLKSSSVKLRTVHKVNLGLIEELNSLRRVCIAVEMERRDLRLKLDLEGQIVKQMVRQLRQAKAKEHVCVATSTPNGTQVLPEDAEISIIPSQQSTITISDEDLEEGSETFKLCNCNDNDVYDQTTLKLDTPDLTQNLKQSENPIIESKPNNKSGNLSINESDRSETRSARKQSTTNLVNNDQNQSRNNILEESPKKLSENLLRSDLELRPRYPSRYLIDPGIKLEHVSSQSSRNKMPSLSYKTQKENPPKQSPSSINTNLEATVFSRSKNQSKNEEHLTREASSKSKSNKENTTEECDCQCSREETKESETASNETESDKENNTKERCCEASLSSRSKYQSKCEDYLTKEASSKSESDKENNAEECQCTYEETKENENASNKPESDEENNAEESQSQCTCEKTKESEKASNKSECDKENNAEECQCQCTCEETKASGKSESDKEDNTTECQCQCTCEKSEHLAVSDYRSWLITPEGIMKGLEALKQTFLGRTEDHYSIINETAQAGSSSCKNQIVETKRKNRDIKVEISPRNQSENLRIASQSTRNQSRSLSERSPRDKRENQQPASSQSPFSLRSIPTARTREPHSTSRNIITEPTFTERNENIRSDLELRPRYPSRYVIDPGMKLEHVSSQSSRNKKMPSLSFKTQKENPPKQSPSSKNTNFEATVFSRYKNQSKNKEHLTREASSKPESNKENNAEECDCQNSCEETKESETASNKSESDKENNAEECQSQCCCETSVSSRSKYQSKYEDHLKKEASSKSESDKENNAEECQCTYEETKENEEACNKSESDEENNAEESQSQCTCEETKASCMSESDKENNTEECQCPCEETKASENLPVSDYRSWLVTPEGIMKGLEALKQTFLGRTEDYYSIINETAQAGSSSCKNQIVETKRKKSVTIQEPVRSNKCINCDEEQGAGCASPNRDRGVQKFKISGGTEDSGSVFFMENAGAKSANLVKKESAVDSGGSSCAGACEQYYRDKLLATLQILENKEETIRVQGCSLVVAGDRIAELTKRASELRQELEHKARELNQIRQFADNRVENKCVSVEMKEAEPQKHLVETLEDNLSTVIELYRECFYETAKQEELIDMLRKSYLDVRLMEKDKTEKISRMQNVINTQKRSIEQCQDVVLEVESLKSEISTFLNSSNNDSGMWERGSESPDVSEELADILEQLRQLQQMLTSDCTCGLKEEFSSVKKLNRALQTELEQQRQRNNELEGAMKHILDQQHEKQIEEKERESDCTCGLKQENSSLKERNRALETGLEKQRQRNNDLEGAMKQILDQQYEKQIKEKERQLEVVVKKLADMEDNLRERDETCKCETLTRQLQQTQVMLTDKTAELVAAQKTREAQESTIRSLQQDMSKSEQLVQEGLRKLSEVAASRAELLLESQASISELEQRLRHATRRCRDLEASCREREACLEEAHIRGARLCQESRRVTTGLKQWMREKKQLAREQQEKIRMQRLRIRELERCVGVKQNLSDLTSLSETDPSSNSTHEHHLSCDRSSRCHRPPTCRSETATFPRAVGRTDRERENETASCSKCASNRPETTSEMASCSRAPVPPRRKKRQSCEGINYPPSQASQILSRDRYESPTNPDIRWSRLYSRLRHSSPTEDVLERVEHLHAALSAGRSRWGRPRR